jgi:hypothetical protein
MDYDLTRISPDRAASQYPRQVLRNDRHGNDRVEVRTDTVVRNRKVVVHQVKPGSPVMQSVGSPTTNRRGIVRFTLKDRQKSERRWFIAHVAGTGRVLPGESPSGSVL